jgi:catechol 2,3-dioxygenase-like lactoylglutathione lyase family enzyme
MDYKLELVPIPVTDVDRALEFYKEKAGFTLDVDHQAGDDFRVVQLTPPGSACSIVFGKGIVQTPPGSVQALHLVVTDIRAARAEMAERGVEISEIQHFEGGQMVPGAVDGRYESFAFFSDPDGNGWALQGVPPSD